MTLDAAEFSRRFLLRILPDRFVKIRHHGLLCSPNIKSKLFKYMKMTVTKVPGTCAERGAAANCYAE
ncbi:MAG TPA: transposase [Desulfosporosinus sp.]|nr:transposase [Desulfosporosinus sp.]